MIEIKVDTNNTISIINWCKKFVGPQKYWIHNKIGGDDWFLIKSERSWKLRINDDKKGLLAILKFSERLENKD